MIKDAKQKSVNLTFNIDIHDENYECDHHSFEIIEPCCTSVGSSGYVECDCGGVRDIICHNIDCTGFDDDFFIEKIYGGGSECDT